MRVILNFSPNKTVSL